MATGSCHCGKVKYEVQPNVIRFSHCHCHDCRKIHGTTYGSSLVVKAADFRLTQGADQLTAYESSPGKNRYFCRTCGAHIYARAAAKPDNVIVRAGTIDGDPGERPQMHIWVSAKAPWYEIHDDLPQYAEWPPARK